MIGNPDDNAADLSAGFWELLHERKASTAKLYDRQVLSAAADLLVRAREAAQTQPSEEELVPFSRRGRAVRYARWYREQLPVRYARWRRDQFYQHLVDQAWEAYQRLHYGRAFDPAKHPRGQPENAGQFAKKDAPDASAAGGRGDEGRDEPDRRPADPQRSAALKTVQAHFAGLLAHNKHLTPAKQRSWHAAAAKILARLPQAALTAAAARVRAWTIQDADTLTAWARGHGWKIPAGRRLGGAWDRRTQTMHLADAGEFGHELAHALDYESGERRSDAEAWQAAWRREAGKAKAAGMKNTETPAEWFAEFLRWAWKRPGTMQRTYPQSWAYMSETGLSETGSA